MNWMGGARKRHFVPKKNQKLRDQFAKRKASLQQNLKQNDEEHMNRPQSQSNISGSSNFTKSLEFRSLKRIPRINPTIGHLSKSKPKPKQSESTVPKNARRKHIKFTENRKANSFKNTRTSSSTPYRSKRKEVDDPKDPHYFDQFYESTFPHNELQNSPFNASLNGRKITTHKKHIKFNPSSYTVDCQDNELRQDQIMKRSTDLHSAKSEDRISDPESPEKLRENKSIEELSSGHLLQIQDKESERFSQKIIESPVLQHSYFNDNEKRPEVQIVGNPNDLPIFRSRFSSLVESIGGERRMGYVPLIKSQKEDLFGNSYEERTAARDDGDQLSEKVKCLEKEKAELKRICLRLESQLSEQSGEQREIKRIFERLEAQNSKQEKLMQLLKQSVDLNKEEIDSLRRENQRHRSFQEHPKKKINEVEFAVSPIRYKDYQRDISTCTVDDDKVNKSPVMSRSISANKLLTQSFGGNFDGVHEKSNGNFTTITSNVTNPKSYVQENNIEVLDETRAVKSRDTNTDAPHSKDGYGHNGLSMFRSSFGKRKIVVCNVELEKRGGKLVGSFDLMKSDENL
mmetsp:Transcript_35393/g.56852  ORF Transcript_35393/g.56852 Transcript_35393/m.56852 type:complete len:571 (+) Transcript_35393:287-1999(+)